MITSGMNVAEVRQLAQTMQQGADRLRGVVSTVDGRVSYSSWVGPQAERFRHDFWPARRSQLLHAAEALQGLARSAANNADEQERVSGGQAVGTSGSESSSGRAGPSIGALWTEPKREGREGVGWEDVVKVVGLVASSADKAFADLKGYAERVSGSVRRSGVVVEDYWRWAQGHAHELNRFMSAGDAVKLARGLPVVGVAFDALGAGIDGHKQWQEDQDARPGDQASERWARAAGGSGASFAAAMGVTALGGAVGQLLIPVPGVGAFVGAAVANGVYTGVDKLSDDKVSDLITDAGAAVGSGVHDGAAVVVDLGGDVLKAGSDLLGEAGDRVDDLVEDIFPW